MDFKTFADPGLAQYSYLIACPETKRAAVVDPRRDVDVYLSHAEDAGLRIAYVLETHVHADYASGAYELARRSGAEAWASAYAQGEEYPVAYPHRAFSDGDALSLGTVRIVARHAPGHTPEHLVFLVYDETRSRDVPQVLLSGDFLLIGSVGRPDLLGEGADRPLAERLFDSTRGFLSDLPDGLEVRPAHGAGSACGAGMASRPLSTLGYERATNRFLAPELSCEDFVARVLEDLPPMPSYYPRMKALNAAGPPPLGKLPRPQALSARDFADLADRRYAVLDLRETLAFNAAHVSGSFGIALGPSLSQWAAEVLPHDRPLLLVPPSGSDPEPALEEAVRALIRVGLDDFAGYLDGGMDAWLKAGLPTKRIEAISVPELHARLDGGDDLAVLDVRSDAEWQEGHIEGAVHVPLIGLSEQIDALPDRKRRLAVYCGSGYRSTVAASVLERAGFDRLLNVMGGMTAWRRAGLETVKP